MAYSSHGAVNSFSRSNKSKHVGPVRSR